MWPSIAVEVQVLVSIITSIFYISFARNSIASRRIHKLRVPDPYEVRYVHW